MLTAEGCRNRRLRLWERLAGRSGLSTLVLADPVHLRYLANFYVDPFSLGADYGGLLVVRPDGHAKLFHDKRLPASVDAAHVDQREIVPWYDGQSPGQGPRRLALRAALEANGGRIHDSLADSLGALLIETLAEMRRAKDADEVDQLRACMRATEAGHAWAHQNLRAGMTELQAYQGIANACVTSAGHAVIVYGDFAVSPGPTRRGGSPTQQVLKNGDMFIVDYSVVIGGYRSDFTNTLVVGGEPNSEQKGLYTACVSAMAAGEGKLRAGELCQTVYDAVRGEFEKVGLADQFPHHAGHGLGLAHPEAPYLVRHSTETLIKGDVVTLEPGVYVEGVGGIRIEHNYLVKSNGFERLSNHVISLT
jgi:Xaa-Pro dipeptidase